MIRIANGQGFWGDWLEAPVRLIEQGPIDYLALDYTTLRHLEILEPLHHDAPRNSSLYGALNRTVTPMGARLLRQWLSQPLSVVEQIRRRQDAARVEHFRDAGLDVDDVPRVQDDVLGVEGDLLARPQPQRNADDVGARPRVARVRTGRRRAQLQDGRA